MAPSQFYLMITLITGISVIIHVYTDTRQSEQKLTKKINLTLQVISFCSLSTVALLLLYRWATDIYSFQVIISFFFLVILLVSFFQIQYRRNGLKKTLIGISVFCGFIIVALVLFFPIQKYHINKKAKQIKAVEITDNFKKIIKNLEQLPIKDKKIIQFFKEFSIYWKNEGNPNLVRTLINEKNVESQPVCKDYAYYILEESGKDTGYYCIRELGHIAYLTKFKVGKKILYVSVDNTMAKYSNFNESLYSFLKRTRNSNFFWIIEVDIHKQT